MFLDLFQKNPRVFTLAGKPGGKTLLVTAGMDGDEYAGMEAARRLVQEFYSGGFSGRLVVIPIMNRAGFWAECSHNPEDDKFPKFMFPGRANGTPTERLIHWLVDGPLKQADVWYDMHGAALTEGLRPFVWLHRTGERDVDVLAQQFIRHVRAEVVMFEETVWPCKAKTLARQGKMYVVAESGSRTSNGEDDVARHLDWAHTMMGTLGMIEAPSAEKTEKVVLRSCVMYHAPCDGRWLPRQGVTHVSRGSILGHHSPLDGSRTSPVCALSDGVPLWWKETPAMRKGDILFAIGKSA
ncbi:succinylglutamate desuccinylase/aspartoacylase family protein [Candidatus Uhrbacteria bacterium]|nr:succinylglutamate desuccinylase/aspartoacylase family protein [Candidatus Uhrbacteria bacterium]